MLGRAGRPCVRTSSPGADRRAGTLREGYTGHPITSGEVVLGHFTQGVTFKVAFATRPDASGRFRFDGVQTPEHLSLRWKPDEGDRRSTSPAPSGLISGTFGLTLYGP